MVFPGADLTESAPTSPTHETQSLSQSKALPFAAPLITRSVPHRNLLRREFIGPLVASRVDVVEAKRAREWFRYKRGLLRGEDDRDADEEDGILIDERRDLKDRMKSAVKDTLKGERRNWKPSDWDLDMEEQEFHERQTLKASSTASLRSPSFMNSRNRSKSIASTSSLRPIPPSISSSRQAGSELPPLEDWHGTCFLIGEEFYRIPHADASAASSSGQAGHGPSPGISIDIRKHNQEMEAKRRAEEEEDNAAEEFLRGDANKMTKGKAKEKNTFPGLSPPPNKRGYTASSTATSGMQSFHTAYTEFPLSSSPSPGIPPSSVGVSAKSIYFDATSTPNMPPSSSIPVSARSVYFDAPTIPSQVIGSGRNDLGLAPSPGSMGGISTNPRSSQEESMLDLDGDSSRRALVGSSNDETLRQRQSYQGPPIPTGEEKSYPSAPDLKPSKSNKTMPAKLRSALRGSRQAHQHRHENSTGSEISLPTRSTPIVIPDGTDSRSKPAGARTVQFPASPPPASSSLAPLRKRDKALQGFSALGINKSKSKLKSKAVNGSISTEETSRGSENGTETETLQGDAEAADPREVLARSGDEVAGTSAGVIESVKRKKKARDTAKAGAGAFASLLNEEEEEDDGEEALITSDADSDSGSEDVRSAKGLNDVILRERMLVRVGRNREKGTMGYDEEAARRFPCVRLERMEEYLVVYRKGRVELYSEWHNPLKDYYYKSKRLCYTIPLNKRYTSFSMFSMADQSFSLTVDLSPWGEELAGAHGSKHAKEFADRIKQSKQYKMLKQDGSWTQVFVFIGRNKKTTRDWTWEIWRELGGELPDQLQVNVPDLESIIKLPIPSDDFVGSSSTCKIMTRKNILQACEEALLGMPHVRTLLEEARSATGSNLQLELAWQRGDQLDWISANDERTDEGRKRNWAVLEGFSVIAPRISSQLQLRAAFHTASEIRLEDGKTLTAPPGIEGFLVRKKGKNLQAKKGELYIHTHAGNLYATRPKNAIPPLPPNLASDSITSSSELLDVFQRHERKRHVHNVLRATGMVDLRDMSRIRLLSDSKDSVEGRSFEVTFRGGEIVYFEASFAEVAKIWVSKLEALRDYERPVQRADGRSKMETSSKMASTLRGCVEADAEMEQATSALLSHARTWCAIEGCHAISQSGRVFVKTVGRQFRAAFLVLTDGYLERFRFSSAPFHQRTHRYSLRQAYIYSGLLAQGEILKQLKEDPWSGDSRFYQDGVRNADPNEERTFVIWLAESHKASSQALSAQIAHQKGNHSTFSPSPLGSKPAKLLIVRCRSKAERDQWVWALNIQLERESDAHREITLKNRYTGNVMD